MRMRGGRIGERWERARHERRAGRAAAAFSETYPFLRDRGTRDRGVALVVSLVDWPYQLKLEGMLLKALDQVGFEPVVLTTRSAERAARSMLAAFGVERILRLDDFMPPKQKLQGSVLSALERYSVQSLKELYVGEANIGRHALSSVSRSLHQGSLDPADGQARTLLEQLLSESMRLVTAGEGVLEELEPQILLFNEARYADCGPLFDIATARSLNVVQFVSAFSDDALVFKRYTRETRRVHPRSLSDETWAAVREEPWTDRRQAELDEQYRLRYAGSDLMSRRLHSRSRARRPEQILEELGLDRSKPTAVVFSHVLWDGNLFYGEDLFDDQGTWLVETVREAVGNRDVNWIVKLHPANVWKLGSRAELAEVAAIRDAVGPLPAHVRLLPPTSDIATTSLFELASWGLTIRGTVGVELPCLGVPVLTGGTGHYSGRGFTVDSGSPGEYRARLRTIQDVPPLDLEETLLARKHAHALFCRRPLQFTSFRTVLAAGRESDVERQELVPTVTSSAELRAARDLASFAAWAAEPRAEDYLVSAPSRARGVPV